MFRNFDPEALGQQSQPKACEACYSRKVRCDIKRGEESCKNCRNHGNECKPRSRKRKGEVSENAANGVGLPSMTNTGRKRQRSDGARERPGERQQLEQDVYHDESEDLVAPLLFVRHHSNLANSPTTTADAAVSSIDEFHNSSYLSRAAVLGMDFPDIDHSHADQPVRQHKISETELKVLQLYGAFDLPELPLRQSLIEAFNDKCWTWMPVIDLPSHGTRQLDQDVSLLLLQAVLLVGALMRPDICSKETCDTYYSKVKALIHSGYERNPLNVLAALCLIQYYTPTAPKDVSVDTPRFWWSCALGVATQVALHRQPVERGPEYALRRRLWWTLYVRDSLMSSAHGRPRLLRLADSTIDPPTTEDFPPEAQSRAQIFMTYVSITEIMCDLCELLVNSDSLDPLQRFEIEQRLLRFVRALPHSLHLYDGGGFQRPYDFELAQLHIPLLTTIIILHRPQTIFAINQRNAVSIAAAHLNFRIFQAVQLREQTRYLSSSFSWYLLVTAIPHLSSLRIPALRKEANNALDALEEVLSTLGTVRPSAVTNLRNVRAIRRAINAQDGTEYREAMPMPIELWPQYESQQNLTRELLGIYGPQAVRNLDAVSSAINHAHGMVDFIADENLGADLNGMTGGFQRSANHQATNDAYIDGYDANADPDDALASLFGTHFQENMWMRNWIDELQPFTSQ